MNFYVYLPIKGEIKDGFSDEPMGTENRRLWKDLKTKTGAIRRAKRLYPEKSFKIWSYTNFYDQKTFKLVHVEDRNKK